MRALIVALALLILYPLNVPAVDSTDTTKPSERKTEKKAREKTAEGIVKAIDTATGIIVIQGREEFIFTADEFLLKEININDKVIIKYTEKSGRKYANSIKPDSKKKSRKQTAK